ncbi:MAG: IS30 family transposase [Rhodanobacteraceae bacterium]
MNYAHLSQEERYQIQCLQEGGWSMGEIGRLMRRNKSTISRELNRNLNPDGAYAYRQAQHQSVGRRRAASSRLRITAATWAAVEARLCEDWSPEQIAGEGTVEVSHERIYQHVVADQARGGSLWKHLRRRRRCYRRRWGPAGGHPRLGGRRIGERPAGVATRWRVGDWEGDTIVGKGLARIVTLVDRKSGFVRLQQVPDGKADTVAAAAR